MGRIGWRQDVLCRMLTLQTVLNRFLHPTDYFPVGEARTQDIAGGDIGGVFDYFAVFQAQAVSFFQDIVGRAHGNELFCQVHGMVFGGYF